MGYPRSIPSGFLISVSTFAEGPDHEKKTRGPSSAWESFLLAAGRSPTTQGVGSVSKQHFFPFSTSAISSVPVTITSQLQKLHLPTRSHREISKACIAPMIAHEL
ncbi:hypothetical protein DL98DRAFT_512578 [Cadophora sp. DSE1049]|nr:hypothetical protein DL98DRAFT_512578 [Cadophora sp. DSE1049]